MGKEEMVTNAQLDKCTSDSKQIDGDHYKRLNPEPFEVVDAWGLDFYRGNALKYLARAGHKGNADAARTDLLKAAHYCEEAAKRVFSTLEVKAPVNTAQSSPISTQYNVEFFDESGRVLYGANVLGFSEADAALTALTRAFVDEPAERFNGILESYSSVSVVDMDTDVIPSHK